MNNYVVPPYKQQPYAYASGKNFDGTNDYVRATDDSIPWTDNDDFMPNGYDGNKLTLPSQEATTWGTDGDDLMPANQEATAWGADVGLTNSDSYATTDFDTSSALSQMGELSVVLSDDSKWDSYYERIKQKIERVPGGVPGLQALFVLYLALVKKIIDYLKRKSIKKFNDKLDSFMVTFSQISLDSATNTNRDAQIARLDVLSKQVTDYNPSDNEKEEIQTNLLSLIVSMKTFLQSRAGLVGGRRGTKRRRRRTGKRIRKTNKRRRQKKTHKRRKH